MPGSAKFQREQALRDTQAQFHAAFRHNFGLFNELGAPALQGMIRAGVLQGQRASQDLQGALGSLGGGSSGLGAISRSFAQSFAANNAAQARAQFTQSALSNTLAATQGNQQIAAGVPTEGPLGQFGSLLSSAGIGASQLIPGLGPVAGAIGGLFGGGGQPQQFGNLAQQNQAAPFGQLR